MQGIFQKENTDKARKYGIYRHLPTYEKIIRNLVSFFYKKSGIGISLMDETDLGGPIIKTVLGSSSDSPE